MIYVYVLNNIAHEIIPEYDKNFPSIPIEERYSADFLAHCISVAEEIEVKTGYIYDATSNTFSEPVKPDIIEEEPVQEEITE